MHVRAAIKQPFMGAAITAVDEALIWPPLPMNMGFVCCQNWCSHTVVARLAPSEIRELSRKLAGAVRGFAPLNPGYGNHRNPACCTSGNVSALNCAMPSM
jgi:hypothetical protein